jgi:type II secretory pathway component PulM
MLTISAASMFAINVLAGVAILLLSALVYSTLVVPLLAQRVSGRTITAAPFY